MRNVLIVKWVLETMYNHYEGVDPNKRRPVLVWNNNSELIEGRAICFYCSTKIDNFNEKACVLIEKSKNPAFSSNTYVWIHKPLFVKRQHFSKCKLTIEDKQKGIQPFDNKTKIIDQATIKKIANMIELLHKDLLQKDSYNNDESNAN